MKSFIYIVGTNKLQNELLAAFLHQHTGHNFVCVTEIKEILHSSTLFNKIELVLFDFQSYSDDFKDCQMIDTLSDTLKFYIAFFNVPREIIIRHNVLCRNLRGIFCKGDALDLFPKGVLTILEGQLWYSWEIMSQILRQAEGVSSSIEEKSSQMEKIALLTPREREILVHIAEGKGNKEIANYLGVSLNTVKTHIYHLFKKIGVTTRTQASLWSAKNF
ncbi:MAG: response regulator transcription factor [Magnetococcus sp. DMHC-6]